MKQKKEQGSTANILQKYLRGCHVRMTYRKKLEGELTKNLGDLDKLAQVLLAQKQQTLRLPLDKVILLIDTLRMITRLRKGRKDKPKGAKGPTLPHLNEVTLLMKWLDKGLDSPKHNFLEQIEFSQKDPSSS